MKRIRIWNLNYAGAFLVLGCVFAPLMAFGIAYWWFSGMAVRNINGIVDWVGSILVTILWVVSAGFLMFVGIVVPEIWVELGDAVRYRTLLRTHTRPWSEVTNVYFEDRVSKVRLKMYYVPIGLHRLLVIELADGRRLLAKVNHKRELQIRQFLSSLEESGAIDAVA